MLNYSLLLIVIVVSLIITKKSFICRETFSIPTAHAQNVRELDFNPNKQVSTLLLPTYSTSTLFLSLLSLRSSFIPLLLLLFFFFHSSSFNPLLLITLLLLSDLNNS